MYTAESFLKVLKPYVLQDMKNTGILASLTASQAFIESNKGNSKLTQEANNLFGMKGEYDGQYVTMPTTEYYNGVKTRVNAKFRKYPNWLASIADHSRLFNTSKRYANLRGCTDYRQACIDVQKDGYATSPTYANTLIKTIDKYELYEWDVEVLSGLIPGMWHIGQTYTTQQDLNVRDEPDGKKIPYDDMTPDGKEHGFPSETGTAILKKGTEVTVQDIMTIGSTVWLKIPSGWICGKNSKNVYVA